MLLQLFEAKIVIKLPVNTDKCRKIVYNFNNSMDKKHKSKLPIYITFKVIDSKITFNGYLLYNNGFDNKLKYKIFGEINDAMGLTILNARILIPPEAIIMWPVFYFIAFLSINYFNEKSNYLFMNIVIIFIILISLIAYILWNIRVYKIHRYLKNVFEAELS